MRDRLRHLIAAGLDLLPGQCTISLRQWADRSRPRTFPWSPNTEGCRIQAALEGVCHPACGKFNGRLGGARGGPR